MDPTAAVIELSRRFDGEIPGLEVHRETLEDVYLSLLQDDRDDDGGDSE
jgi:ABC-2 type transport system ATP-binding protein